MHCNGLFVITLSFMLGIANALPTPDEASKNKAVNDKVIATPFSSFEPTSTTTDTVAPTHTAPSTCTTYYPTVLRQLMEVFPDVMQNNTADSDKAFHVGQSVSSSDGIKYNHVHQYVAFDNIAAESWDCQLMVSWPDNAIGGMVVDTSSVHGSSATSSVSLDVYSATYNASAYAALTTPEGSNTPNNGPFATWTSMMAALKIDGLSNAASQDMSATMSGAKLDYFGTVAVNPGEYGVTINSDACGSTMEYMFEIPNTDSRDVSVRFMAEKEKGAGVYLLADC